MAFKRLSMGFSLALLSVLGATSACSTSCDIDCAPAPCVGVEQPPPLEDPGTPPDGPRPTPPGAGEGWTWLLYIDADTYGGQDIVRVLETFAAAKAAPGARVFALVDQLPVPASLNEAAPVSVLNLPAWSDVLLLEVHGGQFAGDRGHLQVLETWDDAGHPMSEEATLAQFLSTMAPLVGTDRVALWLYGHGQGWGGLCEDDVRGGDRLTYGEIAGAIGGFARQAGPSVDLLILNTCYGSCLDAACTLSGSAQLILASEMRTTDIALLGQGAIETTRTEPGIAPKALGLWLTERYRGWEQPPSCGADRAKQGAVLIDSTEIATLSESLRDLLGDILPHLSDPLDPVRLGTVAARTQAWLRAPIACCELDGCVSDPDDPKSCLGSESGCCMLDLKHFLEALAGQVAESDPRMAKIEATLISLGRCVTCRATDAYQQDFGGLSVFLPCARTEFDVYMLGESCPPAWAEFLDAFLLHGCEAEAPALPQFMAAP
jgi:hypothetical protein